MLKAEKSALAAALASIKDAVNSRNTIPILANVLMERAGDNLVVTGTNLDLQISVACPAGFADDFRPFTVPYVTLVSTVKSMPDGSIQIDQGNTGPKLDAVAVKSGRARIKMPTLPATDFHKLKEQSGTHAFTCGVSGLRRCLEGVAFAMSTEESKYYINGIYLHVIEAGMMIVATDGYRMAQRLLPNTDIDDDVSEIPSVTIPRTSVGAIIRALADAETVSIKVSADRIELTCGQVTLITKLVEGTFPDYPRTIPANNTTTVEVNAKALDSAIARVMTVNTEKGSAVLFNFDGDAVTLSTRPGEHGEAEDAIPIESDGKVAIGFNGNYFSDVLNAMASDEVEINLANGQTPAIIRRPGEPTSLTVLMPMRIGGVAA